MLRRGAAAAGAIFIRIDTPNGSAALYGPAPQYQAMDLPDGVDRLFSRLHKAEWVDANEVDRRLVREINFDPDLWIVEVDDPLGRCWLDSEELR